MYAGPTFSRLVDVNMPVSLLNPLHAGIDVINGRVINLTVNYKGYFPALFVMMVLELSRECLKPEH